MPAGDARHHERGSTRPLVGWLCTCTLPTGDAMPSSNANDAFAAARASLGFNGELHEAATTWQLLGNGYRAYNPVLMRFHSTDSESPWDSGGMNSYAYCLDEPINRTDPSGHSPWQLVLRAKGYARSLVGVPVQAGVSSAQAKSVAGSLSARSSLGSVAGTTSWASAGVGASSKASSSSSSASSAYSMASRGKAVRPTDADWQATHAPKSANERTSAWINSGNKRNWRADPIPPDPGLSSNISRGNRGRGAKPRDSLAADAPVGALSPPSVRSSLLRRERRVKASDGERVRRIRQSQNAPAADVPIDSLNLGTHGS